MNDGKIRQASPMGINNLWPGSNFQRPMMYGHYPAWAQMNQHYRMPYPNMNPQLRPNGLLPTPPVGPYPSIYCNYITNSIPTPTPPTPPEPKTTSTPQAPDDIPLPEGPPPEKPLLPNTPPPVRFSLPQQTGGFTPFNLTGKKKRKNKKKNGNAAFWQGMSSASPSPPPPQIPPPGQDPPPPTPPSAPTTPAAPLQWPPSLK